MSRIFDEIALRLSDDWLPRIGADGGVSIEQPHILSNPEEN